jgi:hypothetical protein
MPQAYISVSPARYIVPSWIENGLDATRVKPAEAVNSYAM